MITNHYTWDNEMVAAVVSWIREKSEEFFNDGKQKKTCYAQDALARLNGKYVEK